MSTTYVVDTNVLLHAPNVLDALGDSRIVIPFAVVEELDNNKERHDAVGCNAREVIKRLDLLQTNGDLSVCIQTVAPSDIDYMASYLCIDPHKADNQIIYTAIKEDATLLTNDLACRVKARGMGVSAIPFSPQDKEVYSGYAEIDLPQYEIDAFYENKELMGFEDEGFTENQFVLLRNECDNKHTALGRYTNGKIVALRYAKARPWDISPLNLEQTFLLEALLDPKIKLVTALGIAGTGKTLLSLAAGGQLTAEDREYNKLVYYKSAIGIGPDLGALPGDLDDKLRPFMESAYDAFEFILGSEERLLHFIERDQIELSPLTFLRGRSLPKLYIVADEAQNISPQQIKTLVSRAGEGTKVVLLGDQHQIDNRSLNKDYNGLVHVIDRFKGQKIYAHITMKKSERSELSRLAAELL